MKVKLLRNTQGTIMMETIIMLPIYIVMLGCLFWLGEMGLGRMTLIHGERLRLWENSNRHITSRDFIDFSGPNGIFWFLPNVNGSRDAVVTGVSLESQNFSGSETADGWGQLHVGSMQINTRRSTWSWGISRFTRQNIWNDDKAYSFDIDGETPWRMAARSEDNTPLNSSILSRKIYSGGDTFSRKDDEAYNDSTNWVRIARSRWSNFVVPQVNAPLASRISPYSRLYERWSQ